MTLVENDYCWNQNFREYAGTPKKVRQRARHHAGGVAVEISRQTRIEL